MELNEMVREAADVVRKVADIKPEVGIILGTGLGMLGDKIEAVARISYEDIPHFPTSTVDTHAGELILGRLAGKNVVALSGRFHRYEGYSLQQVTFPVRVMKFLGVSTLLISNAAVGMNPLFAKGDIMMITDHINLIGDNPLIGPNDEELGPRFPDMSEPYSKELSAIAERVAIENGIRLQRGVFVAVSGPNLETRAEYRFLRGIGADVVGMSTVPEAIVAAHMSLRTLGFSIITDECFPDALKPAELDEIIRVANAAEPKLTTIMKNVVAEL